MKKATGISLMLGLVILGIAIFLTLFPVKVPVSFENNGSTCAGISDETIAAELQKIKDDINGQARGSVVLALTNSGGYAYAGPELDSNLFCSVESSTIEVEIFPKDLYIASLIFLLLGAVFNFKNRSKSNSK